MRRNRKTVRQQETIESGSIQQRTVVENSAASETVFCWKIRKYAELKNYAVYYQIYNKGNDSSCVFKLMKTWKTLYVALRCCTNNRQPLFYLANGDIMSLICSTTEISSGLYVGQFPQERVFSPFGDFSKTGLLTLVFTFVSDVRTTYIRDYEYSKLGKILDMDALCCDIGEMYLRGANSDFVINSVGASFKAHKYILFARSEFFREFFKNQDHSSEFTVDASAAVMHVVLLYCYSGVLPPMTEDCLTTTLSVAKDLKIPSLVERCQENLDNDRKDRTKFTEIPT